MYARTITIILLIAAATIPATTALLSVNNAYSSSASNNNKIPSDSFKLNFNLKDCQLAPSGANSYFILRPGYQLIFEGKEDKKNHQLTDTVLNETKIVNGTKVGILEEKEFEEGKLIEISKNYLAVCRPTNDIFYFGEDVDIYKNGKIVKQEGLSESWHAGVNNARAGMFIPAKPELGMKYYSEFAPKIAQDRNEIKNLTDVVDTPAGKFEHVLKVEETTPLEPGVKEYKFWASGTGLIQDGTLKLVKYVLPS
jgi:hypothetical protein